MRTKLRNILRRFGGESGAASVEFVIVFPIFLGVFVSAFEMGMMNIRAVLLERATDVVVREIRINEGADFEYEDVRTGICRLSVAIPDCINSLRIEMTPVDTSNWDTLPRRAECVDRSQNIQPAVNFTNGAENELMLVRVCAVIDPFFPSFGLGRTMPKDKTGGYNIVASSAFVNEPD